MTKVEELQKKLSIFGRGMPYRYFDECLDDLISAARAEGAAEGEEKERLLIKSKVVNLGRGLDHDVGPIVYVPCWVLDNTPEPTEPVKRGEPSQALIDELNELCNTSPASFLAPPKKREP